MLLEILWTQGKVMIVGRDGQQRIWDLASRSLPRVPRRPTEQIPSEVVERDLRKSGIARLERIGGLFDGELPGRERAVREHLRSGLIVTVGVGWLSRPRRGHRALTHH